MTAVAPWGRTLAALLAAIYLNGALTFQNVWPTLWPRPVPELSAELLALLAGLALLRAGGGRLGPGARRGLAALLLLATVLRYAEVSAPPLFGRALNLDWDVRHLPNLLELFARSLSGFDVALVVLGLGVLGAGLALLNSASLAALDRALEAPRPRLVAFALPTVALCIAAASLLPPLESLRRAFSIPISAIAARHGADALEALRLRDAAPGELDALLGPELPAAADLSGLGGDDVVILFLESYGTTLLDQPAYAAAFGGELEAFARRLAAAGWHAASRRLISPAFGGGSWFAHGSLLGGVKLTEQGRYDLFLRAGRRTLVGLFDAAGYRTVAVMPGTQRHWPEGEAFGFDLVYDAAALDYRGPHFGYWRIPDQFTLHRFGQRELARRAAPLFALVVLITPHMPFHPLPPLVADWDSLGDGEVYDPAATARLLEEDIDWEGLGERYVEAMTRSFRMLGDFLAERIPDDTLVVLLGDHQPPSVVAGRDQPWTVPIHLLSRDPARLEGFLARGYRPGFEAPEESMADMWGFARDFLDAVGARSPR